MAGGAFEYTVTGKRKILAGECGQDRCAHGIENVIGDTNVFVIGLVCIGAWDNGTDADDTVTELVDGTQAGIGEHVAGYFYVVASPRLEPVIGVARHQDRGARGLKIVPGNTHGSRGGDQNAPRPTAAEAIIRTGEGSGMGQIVQGKGVTLLGFVQDLPGQGTIKPQEEGHVILQHIGLRAGSPDGLHGITGNERSASQGQFSIDNRDSNTPYIKRIRVVSTIEYYIED